MRDPGSNFSVTLSEPLLMVAMTLAFLCCLGGAIAFHAGFVSYRLIVWSQTLQMAPRVWALPRVQAGSGRLKKHIWDGKIK